MPHFVACTLLHAHDSLCSTLSFPRPFILSRILLQRLYVSCYLYRYFCIHILVFRGAQASFYVLGSPLSLRDACASNVVYQDSALILKLDYISYIRSSVVVFNSPKNFRLCVRRLVFSFRLIVNLTFPFFMSIYVNGKCWPFAVAIHGRISLILSRIRCL